MRIPFGCYLKVKRSFEHLESLNEATQRFFGEHEAGLTFRLHGETNTRRTKQQWRVELIEPVPVEAWGVIVGDAIHCLRSALDQLVYSLATDPTPTCAYPIYNSKKDWEIDAPGMLWSVPKSVRTVIEATQPYHGGDSAHSHPLALIRHLSNLDKHRGIPTAALIPMSVDYDITATKGIASHGELRLKTGVALEDGATIAELPIVPDETGLDPHVDMKLHFMFDVAFGRGPIPSSLYFKSIHKTFYETLCPYVMDVLNTTAEELAAPS